LAELIAHIRLAVLTTQSVVQVQRMQKDNAARRSVMCINRTAKETGVSRAYHRFVDYQTGIVSRLTGDKAYRTDVDGEITEGDSWELPIFLAHMLEREGRLAVQGEEANVPHTLWLATGRVDADYQVHAIDGLEAKFTVLLAWLDQQSAPIGAIRMFLPSANREDGAAELARLLAKYPDISVEYIDHIKPESDQWQGMIGGKGVNRRAGAQANSFIPKLVVASGAVAVMVAAGLFIAHGTRIEPVVPDDPALVVQETETDTSAAIESAVSLSVTGIKAGPSGCFEGRTSFGPAALQQDVPTVLEAEHGWCSLKLSVATGSREPAQLEIVAVNDTPIAPRVLGQGNELIRQAIAKDFRGSLQLALSGPQTEQGTQATYSLELR